MSSCSVSVPKATHVILCQRCLAPALGPVCRAWSNDHCRVTFRATHPRTDHVAVVVRHGVVIRRTLHVGLAAKAVTAVPQNCCAHSPLSAVTTCPPTFADAHSVYGLCCWDPSYDIVTAAGDLIRVAPTGQHAELFRALPWSYGTLGVLVAAELRLIRVPTPYVRLSVSASCQPVPVLGCE